MKLKISKSAVLVGLVVFLINQPLISQEREPAFDLLHKMWEADRTASYAGLFVYSNGSHIETMQIERYRAHGRLSERVVSSSGGISDIRRDQYFLYRVDPASKAILVSNLEDEERIFKLLDEKGALNAYRLEVKGVDVVADHICQIISLIPLDEFRYGCSFCIEPETGIMLSSKVFDRKGATVEQMVFTNLVLNHSRALTPSLTELEANGYSRQQASGDVAPIFKNLRWSLASLPQGFSLLREEQHFVATEGEVIRHLMFGDGVASVSVFVKHMPSLKANESSVSGSLSVLTTQQGEYQVVFLGDVPMVTLEMLSSGFSLQEVVSDD